ncbi:UDP-N-acetylmuramoyl-tripeptide--D-alanyl-D-alanine ligase [Trueperella bialowiezensis]|uniref:UDP-N-acetylmuramoyl-tripeptide--D-alanyl-D-alanine ligase n=1 Tax=Trueperella bialowiezensis TaxID=312285 RepID=A0A448PCE9_9ACTO|nr:UDP-N-acetylmuramoyl-tripeptide--D-alanyl-D-alanine ligase [Trueperella bialowiezensis]VEI12604.1 UDP-N-acetylmuramoyl-tripeptide--D-alanyl-D-alanine ligase [Trueperella bialowiezensis]
MIPISLQQAADDARGHLEGASSVEVTGVVTDTRQISGSELFVAIKGERVDGATLAGSAIEAGAAGVLTSDLESALASGAPRERVIVVPDPVIALGHLARESLRRARAENPALKVVAVTGSVGKTTTKDLLAALLAIRGPIIAPPGSFNNEIGLPLTVLRAGTDTATLVLEMGADKVGNIEYLTDIAPPDVSVVLAVARAHLGEFGGIDNVARAKSELVSGTLPGGTVILNGADERVRAMADLANGPVSFFGVHGLPGVYAANVKLDDAGHADFELVTARGRAHVTLKLVGEHHVANALAAAAVADSFGIDPGYIADVLGATGPASPHRMAVTEKSGMTIIDDSYNANPESMRAGLDALDDLGEGRRRIAVLGAMLELGEQSAAEHAAIGEYAAKSGVDVVVTIGPGTEALAASAKDNGITVYSAEADTALDVLSPIMREGDVILLKGSNGSGVWRVAETLLGEDC